MLLIGASGFLRVFKIQFRKSNVNLGAHFFLIIIIVITGDRVIADCFQQREVDKLWKIFIKHPDEDQTTKPDKVTTTLFLID